MGPLATCQSSSALSQASKDTTIVCKKSNISWWTHIPSSSRKEPGEKRTHVHTKSRWSDIHRLRVVLLSCVSYETAYSAMNGCASGCMSHSDTVTASGSQNRVMPSRPTAPPTRTIRRGRKRFDDEGEPPLREVCSCPSTLMEPMSLTPFPESAALPPRQTVQCAGVREAEEQRKRCWWKKDPHEALGPWGNKNTWRGTKSLDSPGGAPYHSCIQGGACSGGAAGGTEGLARQLWPATLSSPPPRSVCSWCYLIIVYFHNCVCIFFVSACSIIAVSPVHRESS
jgi:hypothetical protein